MSTYPTKKLKLDNLPPCAYGTSLLSSTFITSIFLSLGSKCYRKNPAHFQEFSHSDAPSTSTIPQVTTTGLWIIDFFLRICSFDLDNNKILPLCPFGATCYRKNLLHFAEFSHPFDLLNPDADSSDEEENKKKRKAESEEEEEADGDKTEEYDSDDVC